MIIKLKVGGQTDGADKKKSICGIFDHNVQTQNVKISELHDFQGHPFKVEHDMQLFELSKSIEDKGVLVPLIVRTNPTGSGYEIIAGHRRKAASEYVLPAGGAV